MKKIVLLLIVVLLLVILGEVVTASLIDFIPEENVKITRWEDLNILDDDGNLYVLLKINFYFPTSIRYDNLSVMVVPHEKRYNNPDIGVKLTICQGDPNIIYGYGYSSISCESEPIEIKPGNKLTINVSGKEFNAFKFLIDASTLRKNENYIAEIKYKVKEFVYEQSDYKTAWFKPRCMGNNCDNSAPKILVLPSENYLLERIPEKSLIDLKNSKIPVVIMENSLEYQVRYVDKSFWTVNKSWVISIFATLLGILVGFVFSKFLDKGTRKKLDQIITQVKTIKNLLRKKRKAKVGKRK